MVPEFQTIMLPLLENLKGGEEFDFEQSCNVLAEYLRVEDEDLKILLPGSAQTLFHSNLRQAKSHLIMSGLIENTTRGLFKITSLGKQVLNKRPNFIDTNYLKRFPGYTEAVNRLPE